MSLDSSFDDVDGEVCGGKYSLSPFHYERTRGRGTVITDVNYRNKLKLASEVIDIKEKVTPLGYMPTTQEMLNDKDANEITPLLRQLGISGQGEEISSRKTRKVAVQEDDIRMEGNVPIILNSELFAMMNMDEADEIVLGADELFDPNRPIHEQFQTIKEFALPAKQMEMKKNDSQTSESTITPLSSSVCDESSFSSNDKTESGSDDSSDEMFQPLLEIKQKLYTPRQLYELKKLHLKQILSKGYSTNPFRVGSKLAKLQYGNNTPTN